MARLECAYTTNLNTEDTLDGTGLTHVVFAYPESDLGWLPLQGPFGVLVTFIVASMIVGFIALKPLGVQI